MLSEMSFNNSLQVCLKSFEILFKGHLKCHFKYLFEYVNILLSVT